jgi:phage repressor protein C with HTH and peptisase S24 domain
MQLKHADIWRAVDLLAERHDLSPSGLARKAGLSPTVFNPSKRASKSRKRWPSTESIARILQATGTELEEFVALASSDRAGGKTTLPLAGLAQAARKGAFNEAGLPAGKDWDEVRFPALPDPHAFALEVGGAGLEPVYHEGDRLVLSPSEKPRRGDRVVVRTRKGEILVRELGRESAQKIELLPLNPVHPALNIPARDVEWVYRIVWASQ